MASKNNKLRFYSVDTTLFTGLPYKQMRRKYGSEGIGLYSFIQPIIFREEGYYIHLSPDLIFDLSEELKLCESRIEEMLHYACEVGIYDKQLFEKHGILTSRSIQEDFIGICQRMRRKHFSIKPEYNLLPEEEKPQEAQQAPPTPTQPEPSDSKEPPTLPFGQTAEKHPEEEPEMYAENEKMYAEMPKMYAENGKMYAETPKMYAENGHKKRKDKIRKDTLSSESPLSETERGDDGRGAEAPRGEEYAEGRASGTTTRMLTYEEQMPPCPGTPCPDGRNYAGLIYELQRLKVPVQDAKAIAQLSNYGMIGGSVWPVIHRMRGTQAGTFKQPGKYIISCLLNRRKE